MFWAAMCPILPTPQRLTACCDTGFASSGAESQDAPRSDRPNRHRPAGPDCHLAFTEPERAVPALGLHRWPGESAVLVLGGLG